MKQILFIVLVWAMSISFPMSLLANEEKELDGTVICNGAIQQSGVKRVPAQKSDILVILEQDEICILLSTDYGIGTYRIIDYSTNMETSGEIITPPCSFYIINNVNTSSFDFSLEFENGEWYHLVCM